MRCLIYLLASFIVILCLHGFSFTEEWELVHGIKELETREVAAKEGVIYAAGTKTIYRSEDDGNTWKAVFSLEDGINFIGVSERGIFVCTKKGLFRSLDGESNWKEIFSGIGKEENNTLHVAVSEEGVIYLGTERGLFISYDDGLTWKKDSKEAGDLSVKWVSFLERDVFLVAEKGVYRSSETGWKRVFIIPTEEIEYDIEEEDSACKAIKPVNSILIKKESVFLASDFGIFVSKDKGGMWNSFTSEGLISLKVNRLLFKDTLYAATDRGIFVFNSEDKIWDALYKGMETDEAQSISVDEKNAIWVATNKGLYKTKLIQSVIARNEATEQSSQEDDILKKFSHEPKIRDVQRAGIEYAEVYPEKIQGWRTKAKVKAFLPELSVDYDKTVNYYGSSNRYTVGPYDWGVSVKWDLADLIWNPSQTSIDVRSRLMVQLRDDVLDEITRTYFERRRLQIEMQISPPSSIEEKLKRDLRMQELTADLDGLTGGYFSGQIKK